MCINLVPAKLLNKHFNFPIKKSLIQFCQIDKECDQMETGCLRMMKSCHICIWWLKSISGEL